MQGEEYFPVPSLKMKTKKIDILFQSSVTHPEVVIINSEWLLTLLYKIGWKSFADKLKTTGKEKAHNFITLNWISCFFELLVFSHVATGIKAASYHHSFVRIAAVLYSRCSRSKDGSADTEGKVCCFTDMQTHLERVSPGTADALAGICRWQQRHCISENLYLGC